MRIIEDNLGLEPLHLTLFLPLHIGETIVGRIHMRFRKREPLLGILLGTGLYLLDNRRERLPDNMDDIKSSQGDL